MCEGVITDNPSLQITSVKLRRKIFLTWSRSAILSFQSGGLYRCLIGNKPKEPHPKNEKRIAENSLVMSWLLHSMQPNISKGYALLSTAHEIWLAVFHTDCRIGNDAQV